MSRILDSMIQRKARDIWLNQRFEEFRKKTPDFDLTKMNLEELRVWIKKQDSGEAS